MSVLIVAHTALLLALISVIGFHGLPGLVLRGSDRVTELFQVFLGLAVAAALLVLRAWFDWVWLEGAIFGLLLVSASRVVIGGFRRIPGGILRTMTIRSLFPFLPILILIYVEWLWVALPLYRYDQWTYHLVIAKWISSLGSLRGPLTVDHVFFTGGYEFLGLIPRLFSGSDSFQQGFLDAFTSMMVGSIACRIAFAELRSRGRSWSEAALLSLAFLLLVIFSTGDHEGVSSAKPDFVMMMLAVAGLLGISRLSGGDNNGRAWFWAGAAIASGASFKLTWLHTMLCLVMTAAAALVSGKQMKALGRFIAGVVTGSVLALPMLIKNHIFFGNPLHPAKNPIWSSNIWSPGLDAYWVRVLEKPRGPAEFAVNLYKIIEWLPQRLTGVLICVVLLLIFAGLRRSRERWDFFVSLRVIGLFFAMYLLTWGFFFGHHIAHRFVSGVPAVGVIVALGMVIQSRARLSLVVVALLAPMLWGGEIEVTAMRIGSAFGEDLESFHKKIGRGPAMLTEDLRIIADHKKATFGESAAYHQAAIFSDSIWNYYGPSAFYDATAPVTFTLISQSGIDPDHGCAGKFIAGRDIRYFWLKEADSWDAWPRAVRAAISGAEEIAIPHGRLWFLRDPATTPCQF